MTEWNLLEELVNHYGTKHAYHSSHLLVQNAKGSKRVGPTHKYIMIPKNAGDKVVAIRQTHEILIFLLVVIYIFIQILIYFFTIRESTLFRQKYSTNASLPILFPCYRPSSIILQSDWPQVQLRKFNCAKTSTCEIDVCEQTDLRACSMSMAKHGLFLRAIRIRTQFRGI